MSDNMVRRALRADAAFCAASGAAAVVGARPVSDLLGVEVPILVGAVGAGLVGFAGWLWAASRRDVVRGGEVRFFMASALAWVVATVVLMPMFSTSGRVTAGVVAVFVLALAGWEFVGLREAERAPLLDGAQAH